MTFGFAPVQSEPRFDAMIAQARLAESFGFDTLWAHEHHSQAMVYPDPLMTLAVLAHHTRTVRLGTNMLLLPQWHPLRVAEGAAMVDVLSEGRLILGVAAGYAKDEFATFGIDRKERGLRMEEGLRLIRAVWTQEEVHLDTAQGRLVIIGEPSECVEQITMYRELGIGHIACLMNFGRPPLDFVDASLRRFGKDVLPHFL